MNSPALAPFGTELLDDPAADPAVVARLKDQYGEEVAQAWFAVRGKDTYPDATFTLRLTYGTVEGWTEAGKPVAPAGAKVRVRAGTGAKFGAAIARSLVALDCDDAIIDGEVRYIRVSTRALKKGLVTKAPKRTWKKGDAVKA